MAPILPTANLAVIANPVAGAGKGRRLAETLMRWLKEEGVTAPLAYTEAPGHARSLAEAFLRQGHKLLIIAGGDGAVHEVVNALAGASVAEELALAILPCGKGNDFARALGIASQWSAWRKLFQAGGVRRVDVGRINGQYFTTVAAMGFDAEVNQLVNDSRLPIPGGILYPLMAVRHLLRYEAKALRLTGDFGVIEGRVFLTAIGNTAYYGGGMKITPGANAFDGVLEMCRVAPIGRLAVMRLLPIVYSGRHVSHHKVRMEQTQTVRVESLDGPLWIHADGERICQTPVTIEAVHKAVRVVMPPTA